MFGFNLRVAKMVWTAFLIVLLLFITYKVSSTLIVVVFSIFFSYLVYPLIELLERHGPKRLPRTAAIGIVFLVVILLVAILGSIFGARIEEEAIKLSDQLPTLLKGNNFAERIPLPEFMEPLRARILSFMQEQLSTGTGQAMPLAKEISLGVMHAASNLIYLVLVPVLSFC
jgi:predicted PurR-regulated permease PerM